MPRLTTEHFFDIDFVGGKQRCLVRAVPDRGFPPPPEIEDRFVAIENAGPPPGVSDDDWHLNHIPLHTREAFLGLLEALHVAGKNVGWVGSGGAPRKIYTAAQAREAANELNREADRLRKWAAGADRISDGQRLIEEATSR